MALQSDKRCLTNHPWPLENIGNSLGDAYVNIGDSLGGTYANIGNGMGGAYVHDYQTDRGVSGLNGSKCLSRPGPGLASDECQASHCIILCLQILCSNLFVTPPYAMIVVSSVIVVIPQLDVLCNLYQDSWLLITARISLENCAEEILQVQTCHVRLIHKSVLTTRSKPWIALDHYGVGIHCTMLFQLGLIDVVSYMLEWKKSLVYLPAGTKNDWTTSIHIAASEGDVNMINKLLNHCLDCWDMLNRNNQNALHVVVLNNQDKVVRVLLGSDKCDSLVDEPDNDGNTPLHLLAASGDHVPELINHPREKKIIGRFGKRDFEVKRKYEYMPNPNDETGTGVKIQLREDNQDKAKKADQTVIESIMKSAQIHVVVATLIMTVTFAAGITLPGGFESDPDSSNQGMAILIRKTAFRAFIVFDAIAFTCSGVAIFIYFLMADSSRFHQNKKAVEKFYDLAGIFQCLSMLAVVIAFATDFCDESFYLLLPNV
ncbi:hypothetical protein BC332_14399 [Capsicum chinense]|nr:hypothetical protein BC332_14399 [Capsicum chinense]